MNELREKIDKEINRYDAEVNDVYMRYQPEELRNAILDAVIAALPDQVAGDLSSDYQLGKHDTIEDIRDILQSAKEQTL